MTAQKTADLIYLRLADALNDRLRRWNRALPPALLWAGAGVLAYLASEGVVAAVGEARYPLTQFLLLMGVALLVVIYVQWHAPLPALLGELHALLQVDDESGTAWADRQMREVFSLRSRAAAVIIGAVAAAALWTIFQIGLPYQQPAFQVVGYAALVPIVLIGAHGTYMALALYRLLYVVCAAPLRAPADAAPAAPEFYRLPHPTVEKLYRYYLYNFSVVMVAAYLWLLALILTSPYSEAQRAGFYPFLAALALYPALAFLWVYWQTGRISRRLKAQYVALANAEVQRAFEALRAQPGKEQMELLKYWMDLQDRLTALNPNPFGLGALFSLLIASSSGAVQVALSVLQFLGT